MSTIDKALQVDTSKYQRVLPETPAPSEPRKGLLPERDAFQICSMPVIPGSFPAYDSIRDFHLGGLVPQQRTPLPPPISAQGSGTGRSTTTIISSGGSSTASLPQVQVGVLVLPQMNPLTQFQSAITLASEAWVIFSVSAPFPMRIRTYSTQQAQNDDAERPLTLPAGLGTQQGIIFDVQLDVSPLLWNFGAVIGCNNTGGVEVVSQLLYMTVDSLSDASQDAGQSVTIVYAPLAA